MTTAEYKSDNELTKDTPNLAITGKLCYVYWKDLWDNLIAL